MWWLASKAIELYFNMSLITKTPTSNTTPDPAQGGLAVSSPSNTGHANTSCIASGDDIGVSEDKSCIWTAIGSVSGGIISKTLKITHTSNGSRSGASASNQFRLDYSLNGGGSWNNAVLRLNMTSSQGPTVFSVALPVGQDLTQVQVRDFIQASAIFIGHNSTADATISDIKVEVVTQDGSIIVLL
jgi:hypothetical protein